MFKSGYIAVIGRPNVGKSTLINAFLGEKLMAVSAKPQTTRQQVLGIKNVPGAQMLFLDTPGIHRPHKALNRAMVQAAHDAQEEADLFLFVVEPDQKWAKEDVEIYRRIAERNKPILVVINKADTVYKPNLLPVMAELIEKYPAVGVVPISALKKQNLDHLEEEIVKLLPEGPAFFDDDRLSDKTERFFTSEVIREKVMELTKKEVPYAVAVLIEEFEERPKNLYIRAAIIVDKDSQKGILIGAKGQMIKKIGELARKELEVRLAKPLFLELFIRVETDWTQYPNKVSEFQP